MVSEDVKAVESKRSAYEGDVITGFLERLETPGRGRAGEERVKAGAVGAATSNLQNRDRVRERGARTHGRVNLAEGAADEDAERSGPGFERAITNYDES